MNEEEKRNRISYLIKEVQIHPVGELDVPLKSIEFNFPFYQDGKEVNRLLWEKEDNVDTLVRLPNKKLDSYINVKVEFGEGECERRKYCKRRKTK